MLALIYFALAACVGDFVCRRFYQFESVAHRCAAAILVGLLVSSWFTYLAGLAFFWTSRPLLWANLLFFVAAVTLLPWPKWKGRILKSAPDEAYLKRSNLFLPRPRGSSIADWLLIAGYVVLVSWMMFASFNSKAGKLQIANPEIQRFRTEYRADAELCRRTQFSHGIPAFLRRPDPLPLLVLFSGGKSGVPRTRSSVEPEPTQHNHTRSDARDRDDTWRGAFQFARSRTPWFAALFLFRVALLRPISSETNLGARHIRSYNARTRVSSNDLSISW